MPVAFAVRRRIAHARLGLVTAVMVTFVAAGIAHEYVLYAQHGAWQLGAVIAFTFQGFALLAFALAKSTRDSVAGTKRWFGSAAGAFLTRTFGRIVFLHVLLITYWIALPAFAGFGLPASLRSGVEAREPGSVAGALASSVHTSRSERSSQGNAGGLTP